MMAAKDIDRASIGPDDPLRLKLIAQIAFPDGSMTDSGLKREHRRGNLVIEVIANKEYTTLNDIKAMRAKCRENQRGSASGSASGKAAPASGLSSTDQMKSAQDALQMTSLALIERSKNTSPKGTIQTSTTEIRNA